VFPLETVRIEPSVESTVTPRAIGRTITHAIIPHRFVDHTHSDHIVTISNAPDGEDRVRRLYGDRVPIVLHAMPAYVLAKLGGCCRCAAQEPFALRRENR
jgi:rhamnose utilization protein RhaD (predicted bifunctional aldolase and dehydrogenase)